MHQASRRSNRLALLGVTALFLAYWCEDLGAQSSMGSRGNVWETETTRHSHLAGQENVQTPRPFLPPEGIPGDVTAAQGFLLLDVGLDASAEEPDDSPLDEDFIRRIVDARLDERVLASADATGDAQADRVQALERSWNDFIAGTRRTHYPTVTVNGVFQADLGWFHQDADSLARFGRIQDGGDFRRARLSAKGSVTEQTHYFFQLDFAFLGRPTIMDLWVEQSEIPGLGTLRIGQWKEPFSLEVVSSFRYTTFMERSILFQAFTPFRHLGVGFHNHRDDERMTWAAAVFRSGQDQFGGSISTNGGWGTAERVTWLPMWDCAGEEYLHLGLGHYFNSPPNDRAVFRTIPEFFVGENAPGPVGTSGAAVPGAQDGTPFFISTGPLDVEYFNVLGTELLWVEGPFSLQSEVMVNFVNPSSGGLSALAGAYAQVGYFLTGEHRPYDRKSGAIERVIPYNNLGSTSIGHSPGWGAWEVAFRWSHLDLNDREIQGGTITNFTLGMNWYWNPYTKVVFNYLHSIPQPSGGPNSHTDIFGLRAQIDF